jgi:2'-5' RNA ligase
MTTTGGASSPSNGVTIGVAIAVPEPWGAQLQAYRTTLGDTTAGGIPTHITLMPPHEVDPADVPDVEKHLSEASASAEPFRIHLRGTGTFRPVSPVVFVTLAEGISACEQLALAVRSGPLDTELTFPYHPHVTVAHHLSDECLDRAFTELAGFECDFRVEHFSMYVHDRTQGWVPTRDFALAGALGG